jgi:transposase-like protein
MRGVRLSGVKWSPKVGQVGSLTQSPRNVLEFKKRRQHNPDLKAKVGLEAFKGIEPVHAIASRYAMHPVQVSQWKKEAAERLPEVFARKADHDAESAKERERELFEEIGRLKMELEWLKKKAGELER